MYIATLLNGSFSEENMRSVITFDKGGTWEPLQPPAETRYGEKTHCEVSAGPGSQRTEGSCRTTLHGKSPCLPKQRVWDEVGLRR